MPTSQEFIDYACAQLNMGARLSTLRMFGEYAFYLDGKVIGFACNNSLFIKQTAASEAWAKDLPQARPWPQAKPQLLVGEWLEQPALLRELLEATAYCLPAPKLKKKRC